jgi:hypothetical protein
LETEMEIIFSVEDVGGRRVAALPQVNAFATVVGSIEIINMPTNTSGVTVSTLDVPSSDRMAIIEDRRG